MTKALSRLQKKFTTLREKQERMQQEQKEIKKRIEAERMSQLARMIKKTGFPTDKPAILIGAILAAKEKIDGDASVAAINRYIDLYNQFAVAHPGIEVAEEEEDEDEGNSENKDSASVEGQGADYGR